MKFSSVKFNLSSLANRWVIGGITLGTLSLGAIAHHTLTNGILPQRPESSEPTQQFQPQQIVALGRLEPQGEVIQLSAPAAWETDRIAELLVKTGDRVQVGQVIAVLDARDRLEKSLAEAQQQVRVLQAELAQIKAGAKSGSIAAQEAEIIRLQADLAGEIRSQQATIARLTAEVDNARIELSRYQSLHQEGAVSASDLDQKKLAFDTAAAQLVEAKESQSQTEEMLTSQIRAAEATLNQIAEIRPVDVQAAQSRVDQAIAAAERVEAELQQAYIRSPIDGKVLRIYAHPGEQISSQGIVELGQTQQMMAVTEVYQTDIGKVRIGQAATITGQAFSGALTGTVAEVGFLVDRQTVMSNQPGENLDRRVIGVKVRLSPEASLAVENLTNLQVEVAIAI
ncbi:MAG: ABC exporter membrane fusion protein [Synechococcales bacterium]|nr:ABC exporter membrane fusion protein [Synechococcales bacterium]